MNRTAVYDIGIELANIFPESRIRHWRFFFDGPIQFASTPASSFIGKALGRLVFRDLDSHRSGPWSRGDGSILFVDPLFSLKTRLKHEDIVLCHDVAPISNPEFYDVGAGNAYHTAYKRIQTARPGIVFVSEFTRRRFTEIYPAEYRFSKVIPLYFKANLQDHNNIRAAETESSDRYFLMVGGLERRKNFEAAITAFMKSGLPELGFRLYITGPRGNLSTELLPHLANNKFVEHLGFVTPARLVKLYQDSVALFFPSLVEGFGLPALEATRLGTLSLVSRNTVLGEIVGPDGLTVDPTSINSMVEGLRYVASLPQSARKSIIEKVAAYQSKFSISAFRAAWRDLLELDS